MGWSGIKDYGFGSKNRTPEEDAEYRARCKGVPKTITWTKEKCVGELNDILDALKKILREDDKLEKDNPKRLKQETIRDLMSMMNRILDFMKILYPPTQTNVNVNIETTSDNVIEKLKNWKQSEETPVIIINEVLEKEDG
jgi:hypothetical protein